MFKHSIAGVALLASLLAVGNLQAQAPNPGPPDPLYTAIRNADNRQIQALLDGGTNVNVHDRRGGATPLMYAAAFGSLDTMKFLMDRGADVNAKSAAGATALMWAAADLAKVRLLLDRGADARAVSESGRTALHLAAMTNRSADTVRLLIQRGADVKAIDKSGMSTLAAAGYGDDIETIRLLVDAGLDVNFAHAGGDTPESSGTTPLMSAASHGNLEAVRLLLAKGANVNAVSSEPNGRVKNGTIAIGNLTALFLAAPAGSPELVKVLLDAGAIVNARDARGMTPLMNAVASDHADIETIKLLIARGADLGAASTSKETAGDWAAKAGGTPVVALLRQSGAKVTPIAAHPVGAPAPAELRPTIERGVGALERMSGTFFTNGACGACHAQNATDIAVSAARRSGIAVNAAALTQRQAGAAAQFAATATRLLERFDTPAVDIPLTTLAAFAAGGWPADRATDVMIFNIAAQQQRDGRWHVGGIVRAPIADGDFSRTALGILALKTYGMPGRGDEMQDRIKKAAAWLEAATPLTTEDRNFRLLGLAWAGADSRILEKAAAEIAALQRADGGWSQRREMTSDAYATGSTLYALSESGQRSGTSDTVRRARNYLLSTQHADGTWFVRSRSPKFQPYFDGGFPYEHDQWISSMATAWATAGLALSMPAAATP